MAPPSKIRKQSKILTFKLPIKFLQSLEPSPAVKEEVQEVKEVKAVKEESPSKDTISTPATTIPIAAPATPAEKSTESNTNTPILNGASGSSLMPPPTEGVKKKGVKRTAVGALGPDGLPRPRGKPGPKKKARL